MWLRIVEFSRRWPGWVVLGTVLVVIIALIIYRIALPRELVIATARPGGLYHGLAEKLAPLIEERSGRRVVLLQTDGTVENIELLRSGEAHLAILQAGVAPMDGLAAIAPLYNDVVHVIVRKGSGITTIVELNGRAVALGPEGSGMRRSALTLLEHFRIDTATLTQTDCYFMDLLDNDGLDAAIVTTGLLNPDLNSLMVGGQFELLPIDDAEAISLRKPYFSGMVIPRGIYAENPPIPSEPVHSIATTAFLATTRDAQPFLVRAGLAAIYEDYPARSAPTLIPAKDASDWLTIPLHPSAHAYFRPFEGLGVMTNVMESLVATKELLFALGAGLYLLWLRWRSHKRRRLELALARQHERLDGLLNETLRIERAQMGKNTTSELSDYLDEVTRLKLTALEELTHEDMRGDQRFAIFLMQCANLIRKIQSKLSLLEKR